MTRKAGLLVIVLAFSAGTGLRICPATASGQTVVTRANSTVPPQVERRERAMDRGVHIEADIIREIPQAPRLCDSMDIRKEKVDVGDCKLYCEQEGQGTPLVLLHGGPGATHHHFHPCFSQARDFVRVIYYDQRGCGLSDFQAGKGYSVDQAADDLDRLRQALGIDQWVVLGHSYGGLLAQCYALKYPETLKGLILLCASTGLHDSSGPSRNGEFLSPEERRKISQIYSTSGLSTAQIVYNNFLNGDWKRQSYYKPSPERIAQIALYEWVQDRDFNGIMSRSAAAVDLEGAFAQCPIPTLILEAKWDMSWNTDKPERFRKNHPSAQFVMFEESGHSPFEDEPAKFFRVLKDFTGNLPEVPAAKLEQWRSYLAQWQEKKTLLPAIKTNLVTGGEAGQKPADGSSAQGASEPPTAGAPGTNRVLELDGKTSFVQVADSPALHTFTNAITIETWFKAASFDTRPNMINSLIRKNVTAGEENFLLRFRTVAGDLCVQMNAGSDTGTISAPYRFDTEKWYHLAGVYGGNSITVYVNGRKIGSQRAPGQMTIDQSDLFIGKGDPEFPGGEYFHGWLDETRLWNVARSQAEIQATMNTVLTGKEKGLVAYWNFDDGTARDLSGHGLDGLTSETARARDRTAGENTPGKFPRLAFHTWGSIPFSPSLTRKPLNQHILLTIRKAPRSIEEIAQEVEASSEDVSGALSQLAKCDLVRQAGESRWVTNVPVFVKDELLKAHEIGLRYGRIETDLLRDNIPALKTAYEQCQVSRYHPWSRTSLIVVGALCADFCVSDRIRFKPGCFDERFLPPRHPDGRRWGYSGEEVLASPPSSRRYQFYQNVSSDSQGGITRFGYYYLLDEKRMSPPSGPENLYDRPEGKLWLSLATPATLEEIGDRTRWDPGTIKTALDTMRTWNPPGVVEEKGRYASSIPILSADDLGRLLPEADRVAEIIFKQVTIPMEKEMDEEAKRLGLRFPLPSGTSARDVALQLLSEDGTISPVAQPPVPWNFGVWGWNGRLAMWEDVQ
jgi:proline iminopeptidase